MPTVLITGAARSNSIASGIASHLKAEGWKVCTSDLNSGDYPCDLSDPEAPAELVSRVHADHGHIAGLVLSHAHDEESGVLDTSAESFDKHIAVNAPG
ncbi:SDR family oxidoreductase [Brevibacterium aurantiacum]|uniref:SDR family oxidoreductase n=1 Tax=Brevibacterium aurantiacum TaxID=273384 RepID=A0A556C2Q5_BREAU|nr:SDR family oxidoreductase [Brevibacterium aurantiacum]TSI11725.1 SDR family oxidoreductase [Brevibacterium aurantiacum]